MMFAAVFSIASRWCKNIFYQTCVVFELLPYWQAPQLAKCIGADEFLARTVAVRVTRVWRGLSWTMPSLHSIRHWQIVQASPHRIHKKIKEDFEVDLPSKIQRSLLIVFFCSDFGWRYYNGSGSGRPACVFKIAEDPWCELQRSQQVTKIAQEKRRRYYEVCSLVVTSATKPLWRTMGSFSSICFDEESELKKSEVICNQDICSFQLQQKWMPNDDDKR